MADGRPPISDHRPLTSVFRLGVLASWRLVQPRNSLPCGECAREMGQRQFSGFFIEWLAAPVNNRPLMDETLQIRIHGEASLPTLIYLPGLHGDWTLVGGFLQALNGRVRFVEIAYPRTLVWSLDDYAGAIEAALAQNGITSGWLLGESFGSQPLWALVARNSDTGVSRSEEH